MRIFRIQIPVRDSQLVKLPYAARILHCAPARGDANGNEYAITDDHVDLWFTARDPHADPTLLGFLDNGAPVYSPDVEKIRIRIFGTGHEIDPNVVDEDDYLGTCVMLGSGLVWHVFTQPDFSEPEDLTR